MKPKEIGRAVARGVRPVFPLGVPPQLTALAARCWLHDPEARSKFADIIRVLRPLRGQLPAVATMRLPSSAAARAAAAGAGVRGLDASAMPRPLTPAAKGGGEAEGAGSTVAPPSPTACNDKSKRSLF
jgi:hypothetical protein